MADDNEYEKRRLENIKKNQQLLEQLQLSETASAIRKSTATAKKPSSSSSKSKKRALPVKKEPDPFTPRRTSSRLRGIAAESSEAKRKSEDETAALEAAERQKRQRVAGDLNFGDIVVNGREGNFLSDLKGVKYARTFTDEDVAETTDAVLKETRKKMMGLKIHEEFEPNDIKITPERIYWLGFHPIETKQLVFAGDKIGNLGIYDAANPLPNPDYNADDEEPDYEHLPNLTTIKLHARSISTFVFGAESLYTSSYDGTIRKLDLVAQKSTEAYVVDDIDEKDNTAISAVQMADANVLYFSTLDGRVGRTDLRDKAPADLWELHEKKIGGFSLHPRATHLAGTSSLDRTVKLWDLRKIVGKGENAKPMMVAEHTSRLSVSSVFWNSHGSVVTTSYDDTVKVYKQPKAHTWDTSPKLGEIEPAHVVKHNNQTGRWVTILRAQWHENPTSGPQKFCIGNMNRFVDIYSEDGQQLAQLGAEGVTAVPAACQFHPTQDWVAGGTASGKVCLWV